MRHHRQYVQLCQQSLALIVARSIRNFSLTGLLLRAVPSTSLLKPYEPDNWSDSISPAGDLGWVGSMDRQFVSRCNIRRPLWVPVAPFQCRPYIKRAAAISLMSSPRVLAADVQYKSDIWHTGAWLHSIIILFRAMPTAHSHCFPLQHPAARCVLCGIFVPSLESRYDSMRCYARFLVDTVSLGHWSRCSGCS